MSSSQSASRYFAEKHTLSNPFGCFVGGPLEEGDVDIPEINREAFESCQALVRNVTVDHSSAALMLYGEPGTGKTHVLGRVRKWLAEIRGSVFVLVRMETNARMLWRHLRRGLADALLRGESNGRLVLDRLLSQRSLDLLPERDLAVVLDHLLNGTNLRDAGAWLRGQELPEAALERLAVAQPVPEDDQEAASRNVVVALCSLVAPGPVVLCLDQMEALQNFSGDTKGLFAAGKAISLLHDQVPNAAIICCLQAGFQQTLERELDEPTRQRMLRYSDTIRPLDWPQAQRLIEARLDNVPALAELRRAASDPLWPLSAEAIHTGDAASARKVISRCRDLFDEWRSGEAHRAEALEAALQRMFEERMEPIQPRDAEGAFRAGIPVLLRAAGGPFRVLSHPSTLDFSWSGGNGIALCNQSHSIALTNRLRNISQAWNPIEVPRLLLLRDARLPIRAKAKVTRQRLQSIEERGGRLLPVSAEAVASLAALRRLMADAESGDLAHYGLPISPGGVEQWITGHLPSALDPLAALLRTGAGPDDAALVLSAKLAALLADNKIVSVINAARELDASREEVETCAVADPRTFGVLGGSTPALFQPVPSD